MPKNDPDQMFGTMATPQRVKQKVGGHDEDMNGQVLLNWIEDALDKDAEAPGSVLYSGLGTLVPGDFYLMGFNPGGDPGAGEHARSIREAVAENGRQPQALYSAYTMECWAQHQEECEHLGTDRRLIGDGEKHQRHVVRLCAALHGAPESSRKHARAATERTFSCNAIFARSRKDGGVDMERWWKLCWPVHQKFLAVVRPRVIVTLGRGWKRSAFALLKSEAGVSDAEVQFTDPSDRRTDGRFFDVTLDLGDASPEPLEVRVLGIPHPSYYSISGELERFIRDHIAIK